MGIKLAIFDMAGTTVNEDNVVYKTLQAAINEYTTGVTLEMVLEHGAGKEKFQAIKDILNLFPDQSDLVDPEVIFSRFKIMLNQAYRDLEVRPYPGVEEFLKALRKSGIKVALNTGYDKTTAESLIGKMNWKINDQFDELITASDVSQNRPHPDMILEAMKRLHIDNALLVLKAGDSAIDIEEGRNAGCGMTVGVTTGAQSKDQLQKAKPTYVVDSLSELKEILSI